MSLNNDTTMLVQPAGYNGNGNGMWGGDWSSWIILFLIFGMFGFGGGWGFGGMGGGMFGGGGWMGMNGGVGSEVQRGFDHQSVVSKLDGINQGLCDGFYAQNTALMNGFHGVDTALCGLGNTVQQGFNQTNIAMMQGQNALQAQLAQCCCENREAIAGVRYDMATQARDITDNQNANARAILDAMTAQRIETKDATIAAQNQQIFQLQLAASQAQQNVGINASIDAAVAEILRRTNPTPVPSYPVPNPNAVFYGFNPYQQGGYGYGRNCDPCAA